MAIRISAVEKLLRRAGYEVGGERTARSLAQLEAAVGLPADGVPDADAFDALRQIDRRIRAHGGDTFYGVGQKGAGVARAERRLKALGYRHVEVDGVFDQATQRASRAFEKRFPGLGHDGRIGRGQLERMKQVLHAKRDPGSGPLLKKGFSGKPVRTLEKRLDRMGFDPGQVDGKFTQATARAVRRFQRAFHLERDGVVGKKTWRMLGVDAHGRVHEPGGGAGNVVGVSGAGLQGLRPKLVWAAKVARKMGLVVTSTTGGTHAPGSYHYLGRAVDVAGPRNIMARYYRYMARKSPTELFYDPLGGIKNGVQIGAIGGHGDHVHVAF